MSRRRDHGDWKSSKPLRDAGVVVIGAGVAGLSATRRLRAQGVPVTLIEAGERVGGRAHTITLGGQPFDRGASWLHDAARNPLVALATAEDGLFDSDRAGQTRLSIGGRVATAADHAAYDAAWARFEAVAGPAPDRSDMTLAEAMRPMAHDPWARLIAVWEGAIIAAADADRLGADDWRRNRLGGRNMVAPGGIGAFVTRHLATAARLGTPAHRVKWGGDDVEVETPAGTIRAGAAIVTVSTGVLAGGGIRFDPPLPGAVEAAIRALPMGLLSKIAFPAPEGRLGLAANTLLEDRDGRMTFNAWPQGRSHLIGFYGGALAWEVAPDPRMAQDMARAELKRMLGTEAARALGPAIAVTDWGTDPLTLGAYAYAGPGDAAARSALGMACLGGRVLFAGEATRTDGLAGTVGGAFLSGAEAADRILALGPAQMPRVLT